MENHRTSTSGSGTTNTNNGSNTASLSTTSVLLAGNSGTLNKSNPISTSKIVPRTWNTLSRKTVNNNKIQIGSKVTFAAQPEQARPKLGVVFNNNNNNNNKTNNNDSVDFNQNSSNSKVTVEDVLSDEDDGADEDDEIVNGLAEEQEEETIELRLKKPYKITRPQSVSQRISVLPEPNDNGLKLIPDFIDGKIRIRKRCPTD